MEYRDLIAEACHCYGGGSVQFNKRLFSSCLFYCLKSNKVRRYVSSVTNILQSTTKRMEKSHATENLLRNHKSTDSSKPAQFDISLC